jgi:hypothetical protein
VRDLWGLYVMPVFPVLVDNNEAGFMDKGSSKAIETLPSVR